jgi:hypothetical protein
MELWGKNSKYLTYSPSDENVQYTGRIMNLYKGAYEFTKGYNLKNAS